VIAITRVVVAPGEITIVSSLIAGLLRALRRAARLCDELPIEERTDGARKRRCPWRPFRHAQRSPTLAVLAIAVAMVRATVLRPLVPAASLAQARSTHLLRTPT
jgi:hypothetical protein